MLLVPPFEGAPLAYGKIIPFVTAVAGDATQAAVARANADAAPARLNLETQLKTVREEIERINHVVMEMDATLQRMHAQSTQRAHDRLARQAKIDAIRAQRELQSKASTSDVR